MKFSEALKVMEEGRVCADVNHKVFCQILNNRLMFSHDAESTFWDESTAKINQLLAIEWKVYQEKPKKVKKTYYKHYYRVPGSDNIAESNWIPDLALTNKTLIVVETETREFEI